MWSAQLIHSKPCRAMNKERETAGDWEPFSELVETPIHPLLINIVPSFVNEINPMFYLQLNGEAWRLREVCGQPSTVFQILQLSILPLGYRLMHQSIPVVPIPPPRATAGHLLTLSVPGAGH